MSQTVHTPECVARRSEWERKKAEWEAKYPNYCPTCKGTGVVTWQENQAPFGSGMRMMETMFDICEECVGQEICPRCGETLVCYYVSHDDPYETYWKCKNCGWNQEDAYEGKVECAPDEYYCRCVDEAADRAFDAWKNQHEER